MATLLLLPTQATAERALPVPAAKPSDEASWLHATCNGKDIGGAPQPRRTTMAGCANPNGQNDVDSKPFYGVVVKESFTCRNGKKHGRYTASVLHSNHSPTIFNARVEAQYADGKLTGESKHFGGRKDLCRTHQYKSGLLDGTSKVWSSGALVMESQWLDGRQNGTQTTYERGRKTSEERYKSGLLDGETTRYDPNNGRRVRTERYEQGFAVEVKDYGADGRVKTKNKAALDAERRQAEKLAATPVVYAPPSRLVLGLGLGIGYINDAFENDDGDEDSNDVKRRDGFTTGANLYLASGRCRDIGCAGFVYTLGAARSLARSGYHAQAEAGFGYVVFYVTGYAGIGARHDGDRTAVQTTIMFGPFFASLYGRAFKYVDAPGSGFEAGLQAVIPIGV